MKKLILLFLGAMGAAASAASLEWDANSETNLAGYRLYAGPASRNYITNWVTTNTFFTVTNVPVNRGSNYFAVTAFDTDGLESEYSDEVSGVFTNRLARVTGVKFSTALTVQSAPSVNGPWNQEPELGEVAITSQARFFRLAIGAPPPPAAPTLKRLEPTSGSRTGKLPLMIPRRPVQGLPFPPG